MGIDVRNMSSEAAAALPDRLRAAGFDLRISNEPHHLHPDLIVTQAACRRGEDGQVLVWGPDSGKVGECRVWIFIARGWRRRVRERRERLQAEVTAIIEGNGGDRPLPGDEPPFPS